MDMMSAMKLVKQSGLFSPKQTAVKAPVVKAPVVKAPVAKGRHALKPYIAIVEFPTRLGGGIIWMKNQSAVNRYASKNFKVEYI
jgi:hypothetical protein